MTMISAVTLNTLHSPSIIRLFLHLPHSAIRFLVTLVFSYVPYPSNPPRRSIPPCNVPNRRNRIIDGIPDVSHTFLSVSIKRSRHNLKKPFRMFSTTRKIGILSRYTIYSMNVKSAFLVGQPVQRFRPTERLVRDAQGLYDILAYLYRSITSKWYNADFPYLVMHTWQVMR